MAQETRAGASELMAPPGDREIVVRLKITGDPVNDGLAEQVMAKLTAAGVTAAGWGEYSYRGCKILTVKASAPQTKAALMGLIAEWGADVGVWLDASVKF